MAKKSPALRRLYRIVSYPLEALAVALIFVIFYLLPADLSSRLGGYIGRLIGPRLGYQRRAVDSLQRAFPDLDTKEIEGITYSMWDNLGRVLAELPHLKKITNDRVKILNEKYLTPIKGDGTPCIFFTGHFANWELLAFTAKKVGTPYLQVYRAANNQLVDLMLRKIRGLKEAEIIPKGPEGAKEVIKSLKAGRRLGIMVDQKMNDGIPVELFGRKAMTAPAVAKLSMKYNCHAIPVRIIRKDGCNFELKIYDAIDKPADGNISKMMRDINNMIEEWATEDPSQWLCWLHRRWPED